MKNKLKLFATPFAVISLILFLVAFVLHRISCYSYVAADLINSTVSHCIRRGFAAIGDIFPFSLFEILIILLPLILFFVIRRAIRIFKSGEGREKFISHLAAVVLLIYSGHILALGVAHNATPLQRKMGLESVTVTEENLVSTLEILRDEINALAENLPRNEEGVFVPEDFSFDEISKKICKSYDSLAESYNLIPGFKSRAKGVKNGWAMCYLGISGIYTYPTGEANVNSYFPAYVAIYTAAHEMCHQRGILRENEANFLAYLITITSDDPYLRYSGAMEIYSYVSSALYRTNKEVYYEINKTLSPLAMADFRETSRIIDKYDETIFDKISDKINDMYLQSNGSDGVVSYGYVVKLVVAYYNQPK